MKTFKTALFLLLALICVNAMNPNDSKAQVIAVIANETVDVDKLAKEDLFKIYAQQQTFWDNGNEIKLIDYKDGAVIRKAFFGKLNKDTGFFEKLWQRNKFQGAAAPPVVASNESNMFEQIANTPGAIGFVPITQVKPGVKLLLQF